MSEELSLADRKIVQALLESKKEEALFSGWLLKKEEKSNEKRLIVISENRFFSLRQGKIAREGHWLDLVEIKSPSKNEVTFQFKAFFITLLTDISDELIHHVRTAYHQAFPGVPETSKYKLDVNASRLRELPTVDSPLGGFIRTYKSLCDYYPDTKVREDIVWDMENLFIPGNVKDFNLKEFEQPLSLNDLRALLGALQYNTYFKSLIAKNIPFDKNMIQCLSDTLKSNTALEELTLSKLGINRDGAAQIFESILPNKLIQLTSINIANNVIEDKGMTAIGNYIGSLNRGIIKLDVSNCGSGKLGMTALCNGLKKNVHMTSALSFLNLSGNKLEADGSSALAAFLANPNSVRSLLIANTAANLEVIMGAMVRGCNELRELDLSTNKFTKKESGFLAKYLQSSTTLYDLHLGNSAVAVESVTEILTAMNANVYLKDFKLDLSGNKLGVPGARALAALSEKVQNIASLDLSDNEFGDEGISILAEALVNNQSIRFLNIDFNFKARGKARPQAIESLITMISSESCKIDKLSVAGGPKSELKLDILPFFYALATNETLKYLDVSGHQFGNKGAAALGKALQTNHCLETLKWDLNLTTLQGFYAFHVGLKRNRSVKNMPLPINDISASLKESPEVIEVVTKIEQSILRNQSPIGSSMSSDNKADQHNANQFAFLNSGQREELQKLLYKIKSTGRKVPDEAKGLIADAERQDEIMTNLFNIQEAHHQQFDQQLRANLLDFVSACSPMFAQIKAQMISALISDVKSSYKSLDEQTLKRLQTNLAFGGKDLPEDEFQNILATQAHAQLSSKAQQALHSTVSIVSDYLYEKLQDQLVNVADELIFGVTQEAMKQKEEEEKAKAAQAKASKPPAKAPPKPPPQANKKAAKAASATKGKNKNDEGEAHVEELPKAESNLDHVTKSRPAVQQKRAPPSRKRRPGPPPQTQM